MSRALSATALQSINAGETQEVWLAMAVLDHDDWDEPIRLVRNTTRVFHQGNEFIPFPFDISLPDDEAETTSVVQWVASNASSELLTRFRSVVGPISGTVFWVLASNPDDIEIGPFDLLLPSFEYTDLTIKGALTVWPVLDAVFGSMSMDGTNAPGLF